ncbi:MAG: DUF1761 domain-containing protein [Nanoarchaeota archaeon]
MLPPPIHSLAVIVSAIVGMIIGGAWYSPALFGNDWMKLSGITPQRAKAAQKKGMGKSYALTFLGTIIMAFILSAIVKWVDAQTFGQGAAVAFWLWIGLILPVHLNSVLWEGKSWKLYWINVMYYLVTLIIMGGILASWG